LAGQFHLLTVCTGNMHRSPLAASLLQLWAQWFLDERVAGQVSVRSAGLAAAVGAPMGPFTQQITAALGADGSRHRAQAFRNSMAVEADLVLTATVRQRDAIVAQVPSALKRAFTIREASRAAQAAGVPLTPRTADELRKRVSELASHRSHGANDIVDPQGKSEAEYLQMAAEEVPALAHLARWLLGMPAAEEAAYVKAVEDPATLRSLIERATGARGDRP
jgi:protein-tyrosine phosphatase